MTTKTESSSILKFTDDFFNMISSVMYNSFGFFFLDFLIPVVAMALDASGAIMGVLFSLRMVGFLISASFVGFLTDRYQKKILVALGSLGRGISYFIMYFAIISYSIVGLGFGTAFLGFFAGFYWIPLDALIAEKSHKNNRSKAYGYRTSALARGEVIGAIIGFSVLVTASSSGLSDIIAYGALPVYGVANFYAGYLFVRKVDEKKRIVTITPPTKNETHQKGMKSNLIPKIFLVGILILGLVLFFSSVNGSIARPFLLPFLLEKLADNAAIASFVYIPSGLISIFLATRLGQIADRLHPFIGITIGSATGAVMTFLLINSTNIIIFAILLTLDAAIATMTGLVAINMISRVSISHRGKLLGFQEVSHNVGAIIGPILGGFLWDYMITAPFYLSIIVELLLIPTWLIAIRLLSGHMEESYD